MLAFGSLAVIQVVLQLCWLIVYVKHWQQQRKITTHLINADEKLPIITDSDDDLCQVGKEPRQLSYWTLINDRQHVAAELSIVVVFSGSAFIEPQLSNMMHTIDATLTQG